MPVPDQTIDIQDWINSLPEENRKAAIQEVIEYIEHLLNKTKMGLELTGKIKTILPLETGEGKNGTWKKQSFVIDYTDGNYPKQAAFIIMGDKTEKLNSVRVGQEVTVGFAVASREYNGRWYTDCQAWFIKPTSESAPQGQYATGNTASDMDSQPQTDSELPF